MAKIQTKQPPPTPPTDGPVSAAPSHRDDPLLSFKEVAIQTGHDVRTIHRWATQHGKRRLKTVRMPSGRRFVRQSVVNQILAATGLNGDATEEAQYEV